MRMLASMRWQSACVCTPTQERVPPHQLSIHLRSAVSAAAHAAGGCNSHQRNKQQGGSQDSFSLSKLVEEADYRRRCSAAPGHFAASAAA